jgi:hypothetical protein
MRSLRLGVAILMVAAFSVVWSPPAVAAACAPPAPSETQPGYTVADPWCEYPSGTPFTALPGATVHTGIERGAAYRIEVPSNWNGELVLHAHGYRGTDTTVYVDNSPLRAHLVARGYAWAASSYQTNGYDVGQGVKDSHALIALVRGVTGRPARRVYMTGFSMGGHVTAVAVEHYRRTFAGALPACGVLGDTGLFDYFTDANVTAAALTGTRTDFPLSPTPEYQQDLERCRRAAQRRRPSRIRLRLRLLERDRPRAAHPDPVPVRSLPGPDRRHLEHRRGQRRGQPADGLPA